MNDLREVTLSLPDGRPLKLRHLKEGDATASLNFLEDVAAETDFVTIGPSEVETSVAHQAAYLRDLQRLQTEAIVAALVDGELAGLANLRRSLRSRIRHVAELGISVRRIYWGAGVAKPLCQYALREAEAMGVCKVELRVRQDNERAIKLYRSLGFEIEGSPRAAFFANGQYYDELFMGIVLGDGGASNMS